MDAGVREAVKATAWRVAHAFKAGAPTTVETPDFEIRLPRKGVARHMTA